MEMSKIGTASTGWWTKTWEKTLAALCLIPARRDGLNSQISIAIFNASPVFPSPKILGSTLHKLITTETSLLVQLVYVQTSRRSSTRAACLTTLNTTWILQLNGLTAAALCSKPLGATVPRAPIWHRLFGLITLLCFLIS
jgi:hypothetical protein